MEVLFAVAKINKYATSESGDTLEMVERPLGGLSLVLVDGQRSGKAAKRISNMVARKAIQLLAEGVRDSAAARAAHDYLYTSREGKVSATLNILSIDAQTKTIVISRNNEAPVIVHTAATGFYQLDEPSQRVGFYRHTKPVIAEISAEIGTLVVVYTDGLRHAGSLRSSESYDPYAATQRLWAQGIIAPQQIADTLLQEAVTIDNGRPNDDISILVVSVQPNSGDDIRRLGGRIPF